MIGIIDYRAGNSPSVLSAMTKIGVNAALIKTADEIKRADGIILPGVGSADATMDSLDELGIVAALGEVVLESKKPFLGICVGLQVLFDFSEEGNRECLGWIGGRVVRFDEEKVRVPQMGWNKVSFVRESRLTKGLEDGYFYFVNSYYAVPERNEMVLGIAEYGKEFCAIAEKGNIFASQCHLEKSGSVGLTLLKNFADYAAEVR